MKMDADKKKIILNLILENKSILFGKFGSTITPEMKIRKWKEITAKIETLGIFSKDWKYLRDTTWQNWRKRTVEKRENRSLIGDTTGKRFKYDECDEIILNILESDSLSLEKVTDTPETPGFDEILMIKPDIDDYLVVRQESSEKPKTNDLSQSQSIPISYFRKEKLKAETILIREKIQIAKREKRKLDLEIMKLEKELSIISKQSRLSEDSDADD